MLFALLANLIAVYSLVSLPLAASHTIDVSDFSASGKVDFISENYSTDQPVRKSNNSLGIEITAPAAMMVDQKSGLVLWQKNVNSARSVASLTKLMSALVFLDHNPGWEKAIAIQTSDYREGGRINVFQGEELTVRDLFYISLVASSNTAIMALTRSTGLTAEEFTWAMNQKAKDLGMNQSVFLDPTGLEVGNLATAADIFKLARAAFARPEIRDATSRADYSFSIVNAPRQYRVENTNKLLKSYLKIIAGKTGYLDEAGYCLASQVKGPMGQEVIIVVLGSDSETGRFQELKSLAQWSFDNYVWP